MATYFGLNYKINEVYFGSMTDGFLIKLNRGTWLFPGALDPRAPGIELDSSRIFFFVILTGKIQVHNKT